MIVYTAASRHLANAPHMLRRTPTWHLPALCLPQQIQGPRFLSTTSATQEFLDVSSSGDSIVAEDSQEPVPIPTPGTTATSDSSVAREGETLIQGKGNSRDENSGSFPDTTTHAKSLKTKRRSRPQGVMMHQISEIFEAVQRRKTTEQNANSETGPTTCSASSPPQTSNPDDVLRFSLRRIRRLDRTRRKLRLGASVEHTELDTYVRFMEQGVVDYPDFAKFDEEPLYNLKHAISKSDHIEMIQRETWHRHLRAAVQRHLEERQRSKCLQENNSSESHTMSASSTFTVANPEVSSWLAGLQMYFARKQQEMLPQGVESSQSGATAASAPVPSVKPEKWERGWGNDELAPKNPLNNEQEKGEPHSAQDLLKTLNEKQEIPEDAPFAPPRKSVNMPPRTKFGSPTFKYKSPIMFVRRIEGIMEPDKLGDMLEEVKPLTEQHPIAKLSHGLERVLFSPGVHWLQDPRSRVYNFPPHLQNIPPVTDFAFSKVAGFIPSSQDPDLREMLKLHNKRFSGSTSSLTGILSQLYFLISAGRLVNTLMLSSAFSEESRKFTAGQLMPASATFWKMGDSQQRDGKEKGVLNSSVGDVTRYSVDATGGGEPDKNILTWLGVMLEKFMTTTKEEFDGYLRSQGDGDPLPPLEESDKREAYRFSKTNSFIVRAQLDCHDPRLPGNGVFDIKTRACMPIRLDIFNYEENSGYLIRKQLGKYESFEREYYDLMRSAFLKYQFQVRIGRMDGVIVAYHNTKQMFGFQYVPLEEMDECLFGPGPNASGIGDRVFKACMNLLEMVAEEVVACFPNESVRATFETNAPSGTMNVWVEPVNWDESSSSAVPRPMKQLEVRTWNYLDTSSIVRKPWEAFRDLDQNWTLRWSIGQLNRNAEEARRYYLEAKKRQFRAWSMPSGVDPDDLQEWYEGLNFGGMETPNGSSNTFSPTKFSARLHGNVEMMRRMARKGRRDTEQMREEEAGKPQYVLGH